MFFSTLKKKQVLSHQLLEKFEEFKVLSEGTDTDSIFDSGYSNDEILNTTFNSIVKVKNGEYPYERDSVLFEKIEYNFPLISSLMSIKEKDTKIKIIDFGGSLGTLYFQNKILLEKLDRNYEWSVVEQKHYVEKGKEYLEDKNLKFYFNLDEIEIDNSSSLIIFSGVLQYLKNYKKIIHSAIEKKPAFIYVDRTSFNSEPFEVLTLQTVPSYIYNAQYINRFFEYDKLIQCFEGYELIFEFDSFCDESTKILYNNKYIDVNWRGFFLKRIQK
jgi:putative methyltransferase (TIGR04325 family)